jgi:X-X-X-Leu-X-X-Gly heptad repeat protein
VSGSGQIADGAQQLADGLGTAADGSGRSPRVSARSSRVQTSVDKGLGDVREQAIEVLRTQFAQGTTLARQQLAGLDASTELIAETPGAENTTYVLTQSTSDIGFSTVSNSSDSGNLGRNIALGAGGLLLLMAGVAGGFLSGRRNAAGTHAAE